MTVTAEYIKDKLSRELEATHVEVTDGSDGCGAKFAVVVVSPKFMGVSLLQRQRMVNEILKVEMESIHALTQRTLTPEQWNSQITASAPGKVILFGEHSVVYGQPAIAAALNKRLTVTINSLEEGVLLLYSPQINLPYLILDLPQSEECLSDDQLKGSLFDVFLLAKDASPQLAARLSWWAGVAKQHGSNTENAVQALCMLGYLHSQLAPPDSFGRGLSITIASELNLGAGTGSSAAFAVALAAALGAWAGQELNVAKTEQLAWKAEHMVHGKPSGVDTAISARGGLVRFVRGPDKKSTIYTCVPPTWGLKILLVDSHVGRNTGAMVTIAAKRLNWIKGAAKPLLEAMGQIVEMAEEAFVEPLSTGFTRLDHLVRANQSMLCGIDVSHPTLDAICATAARHGLAAKITGAGGGGNAFILLPPDLEPGRLQALQDELTALGFTASEEGLVGFGVRVSKGSSDPV